MKFFFHTIHGKSWEKIFLIELYLYTSALALFISATSRHVLNPLFRYNYPYRDFEALRIDCARSCNLENLKNVDFQNLTLYLYAYYLGWIREIICLLNYCIITTQDGHLHVFNYSKYYQIFGRACINFKSNWMIKNLYI